MRSWFGSSSTIIALTIKTTDGKLEETIQIQSHETVQQLKSIINDKFQCDPQLQKLVFHGQTLQDGQPLSAYNIVNNSTILLMNANDDKPPPKPAAAVKKRNIFDKSNPFYQSKSKLAEPGRSPPNEGDGEGDNAAEGPYFDSVLNQLAKYHPELPLAVMENSKEIGDLLHDVNRRFEPKTDDENGQTLTEEQQSLTAYYYYLSLASLSAVTSTVASSVYHHLPSRERISTTVKSIIRPTDGSSNSDNAQQNTDNDSRPSMSHLSMSWIKHLQKLVSNTKEEKAAIDRLVSLGFDKTESIEAYLACNKDEALAAVFMSQENNKPTKGAPGDGYMNNEDIDNEEEEEEEEKKEMAIDASMGYINEKHELAKTKTNKPTKGALLDEHFDKTIVNNSVYFKQFQKWMRNIFDDDESYYRYLLLFMKQQIADMTCLEDINYDEEFLIQIGIEHRIHRKRLIKAIGLFVNNKNKFEIWWNETIQFKKYLKEFEKCGIWDLEELLLQIRSTDDIRHKVGITNDDDVEMIWKHVEKLRHQHTLYANIQATGSIFAPQMAQSYMANAPPMMPQTQYPSYPQQPSHGNMNNGNASATYNEYNIPPPAMYPNLEENVNDNEVTDAQQEGAVTQM